MRRAKNENDCFNGSYGNSDVHNSCVAYNAFQKRIKSKWLKSFLYYIPYAVLGAMTFPAIFFSTGSVFSASLGLVGAMLMAFFDKGLMAAAVTSVVIAFVSGFFV